MANDTNGSGTTALATTEEVGAPIAAFSNESNFVSAQRMAKALADSSLVPAAYQKNIANCLIAMEIASRIKASVFAVMQNLDIIHGHPSWRAKFLIATVNACGRFTPLRFRWTSEETMGTDAWGCRVVAKDVESGEECVGPLVTIAMAKAEGWASKNGSKWKTLPELMLMYRSAAFWTRVYAPELSLGMDTADEVRDVQGVAEVVGELPAALKPGNTKALEEELMGKPTAPEPKKEVQLEYDLETGEVVPTHAGVKM